MNDRLEELMYDAGLTAQGAWDLMDQYQRDAVMKFAELIVRECGVALNPMLRDMVSRGQAFDLIKKHFGVQE